MQEITEEEIFPMQLPSMEKRPATSARPASGCEIDEVDAGFHDRKLRRQSGQKGRRFVLGVLGNNRSPRNFMVPSGPMFSRGRTGTPRE